MKQFFFVIYIFFVICCNRVKHYFVLQYIPNIYSTNVFLQYYPLHSSPWLVDKRVSRLGLRTEETGLCDIIAETGLIYM